MPLNKEQILTLTCLKKVDVSGVGPKKILSIGSLISAKELKCISYEELAEIMRRMKEKVINQVTLDDLLKAQKYAKRLIEESLKYDIVLVGYYDEEFPEQLKECLNEEGKIDPPLLLWCRGDISLMKRPGLAVIGTRNPTRKGIDGGKYLAGEFAKRGFNIISGLAIGCDTCGHEGALNEEGKTTAILANGLDWNSIYPPENVDLAKRIVEKGGLLISEYSISSSVNRYALVARDRLQAGLAMATLVVQTGVKGGTMHAASATLKAKKPLFVMKFRDEETNSHEKCLGNAFLCKRGAHYITGKDNIDDICNSIIKSATATGN